MSGSTSVVATVPAAVVEPPPQISFWSLPPEIRNMIYALVVIDDKPLRIFSPRRKYVINKELTNKNFGRLLCVNKQFNAEASAVFYAQNIWVVGNGGWGLTTQTNEHALKKFNSRVSTQNKACIKKIVMEIHCRPHPWVSPSLLSIWSSNSHSLGYPQSIKALHAVSKAVAKHFTGVEEITFALTKQAPSLWLKSIENPTLEESVAELRHMLTTLLKCPKLKRIHLVKIDMIDMQAAASKILETRPEFSKVLKLGDESHQREILDFN